MFSKCCIGKCNVGRKKALWEADIESDKHFTLPPLTKLLFVIPNWI